MFMNELRQGKLHSKRWVVIAPKRAKRPTTHVPKGKKCFFCPGNEKLTPKELYRVEENGKWMVRGFPNKFPAFSPKFPKAYGVHWVIVETPNHHQRFFELSRHHMLEVVQTYVEMMKRALKIRGIKCVLLFKNEGRAAGMSSTHLHSQLIGTQKMFPFLEEELGECKEHYKKHKNCIHCAYIKAERKTARFVCENESFIALTPYASMYPYTVMILPKRHEPDFTKMVEEEIMDFADMLKKVSTAIHTLGYGYNFYIHTSKEPYHHFHLEIRPRPTVYAGFELGSGIIINTMPPEEAAKYLRSKI